MSNLVADLEDVQSAIELAKSGGVKIVDFRFTDLFGTWQHFSIPVGDLTPGLFDEGLGFDGSSIRGFQPINLSDMMLFPDPTTAVVDPILNIPTLSIICNVVDPVTGEPYSRDPRNVARKAEAYLQSTGIADTSYWGPEAEFFILSGARFHQDPNSAGFEIDSPEGIWNSGASEVGGKPNLGYRPGYKGGYFPVPPVDSLQDVRSEMILKLIEAGVDVEVHHHEVATAGQAEIDMRYGPLVKMADSVMVYKYVTKNVAAAHGLTVTFMPKPLYGDNGSGMHVHQSLWKDGVPLFFDESGYALTSEMCRYYIGGLLAHTPSLLAICAPTTNSYRRLVPGFEAPVSRVYSARNRSAACRIPVYNEIPAQKRIEFRCPDPTTNPYLAFAAMLMAGLDGIRNKIVPPDPVDADIYELSAEERANIKSTPGSLEESLAALVDDHAYLLEGGVFTKDLIDMWIDYKTTNEIQPAALRPTPFEYLLYFDG